MRFVSFFLAFTFLGNLNAAKLLRTPYIENASKEYISFKYIVDIQTRSWVSWGEYPRCSKYLTPMPVKENQIVWLYGLKQNTEYCYNIYLPVENSTFSYVASSSTFKTFFDETVSSYTFVVIGNTGYNTSEYNIKLASSVIEISSDNLNFLIHTGNISVTGVDSDADEVYFKPFADVLKSYPVFIALSKGDYGNNFSKNEGVKFLEENFNKYHALPRNGIYPHTYYVDISDSRFIFIDTSYYLGIKDVPSLDIKSKQYKWLKSALSYSKNKRWLFIVMNMPLYSTAETLSEEVKDNLENLFIKYGVDFVIQGYNRVYERTKPIKNGVYSENGIVYLTVGGGENMENEDTGENVDAENNTHGYIDFSSFKKHFAYVRVEGDSLEIKVYNDNLNIIDQFYYRK